MYLIVVNSKSGKGHARSRASEFVDLCAKNGIRYKVLDKNSAEETVIEIKKEILNPEYKVIVAVGGDGLVNMCLQHVAQKPISLGVLPAGTGNDFARAVGAYKKSTEEIFFKLLQSKPDSIDLGLIQSNTLKHWYVQVLSTGFDALVNSQANEIKWPKGKSKYTIATILTLARFKPIAYRLTIDNKVIEEDAMLLSVANGETYGGGMRICPNASNSDGEFDVLLVRPVSKLVLLTIFPKVFFGKHIPHPKIDVYRGKDVAISGKTKAFADGEYIDDLPIRIQNIQNSLSTWLFV